MLLFWMPEFFPLSAGAQTEPPPAPVLKDIPVPVIHVKGSHYEAGYQFGTRFKNDILREAAEMKKSPDWKKVRAEAELFLVYSKKYLPEYVTEVKGTADTMGLEVEDLFPSLCEEIGDENYRFTKGCSDLIASNDVTVDGSVLAAHNNDASPSTQDSVVIVHYQVDGEPEIMAVGYGGLGISVGYNSAGISLTDNQVDSNDVRVGVPLRPQRYHQFYRPLQPRHPASQEKPGPDHGRQNEGVSLRPRELSGVDLPARKRSQNDLFGDYQPDHTDDVPGQGQSL